MKTLLLLLAISISTSNAQISASKKQPPVATQSKPDFAVALNFINSYIKFMISKDKRRPSCDNWIKTNILLTPSFKAKYKAMVDEAQKENPEMGLDFDPIIDAQDFPEEGFVIKNSDPNQGYVTVRGKKWKDFEATMKVVQLNGRWLVDGSGYINIPENKKAKR